MVIDLLVAIDQVLKILTDNRLVGCNTQSTKLTTMVIDLLVAIDQVLKILTDNRLVGCNTQSTKHNNYGNRLVGCN